MYIVYGQVRIQNCKKCKRNVTKNKEIIITTWMRGDTQTEKWGEGREGFNSCILYWNTIVDHAQTVNCFFFTLYKYGGRWTIRWCTHNTKLYKIGLFVRASTHYTKLDKFNVGLQGLHSSQKELSQLTWGGYFEINNFWSEFLKEFMDFICFWSSEFSFHILGKKDVGNWSRNLLFTLGII